MGNDKRTSQIHSRATTKKAKASQPSQSVIGSSVAESAPTVSKKVKSSYESMEIATTALGTMISNSRSAVWVHFERYVDSSNASSGLYFIKCKCNYCGATFLCDTTNGTNGQLKHMDKCLEYEPNKEKMKMSQTTLSFESPTFVYAFNQKEITLSCVRMIILDELSFNFVHGIGFRQFCERAVPKWKLPPTHGLLAKLLITWLSPHISSTISGS
jgi:hypothetical protein